MRKGAVKSMNDEWYRVENLRKSYQEQTEKYAKEGVADSRGDFGSYLSMMNHGTDDMIGSHNEIGDGALAKAKVIVKYLKEQDVSVKSIADMGGGCGFIANELHQICPETMVYSYELAEAAVEYARQHFSGDGIQFIAKAIDIGDKFSEGPFDAIVCHGFYPFCRNCDVEYQVAYINTFLDNLIKGGILMINCLDSPDSLIAIFDQIRENIVSRGHTINKKIIPAAKIQSIVHNIRLSAIFTGILSAILRKKAMYSIIIQKN